MATISYLTRIEFEYGAIDQLADLLSGLKVEAPLVVTDPGLMTTGLFDRVCEHATIIKNAPVYAKTPSNPTEAAAKEALRLYRDYDCDGIVAVGGGSPIDLAKAIGLLATHEEPLAQYAAIHGGVERIGSIPPLVAVPTTAGTGSEVGRAALITLEDGRKLGLISPNLIPALTLCDPDLTVSMPSKLTAATGLDAISHCVETFLSPRINPVADAIALDGLVRLIDNVEKAVANGNNKQARWNMMMGALEGGLTFQKGLGAIHALSHPLGALQRVSLHHGTLNAILLPYVLEWNEAECETKYATIRHRLELRDSLALSEFFADLNNRLDLPSTLGEIGVVADDLDAVSKAAVLDHSSATNPRKCTQEDYLHLLQKAL